MLALDQGHPAAGPDEDPQGWAGKCVTELNAAQAKWWLTWLSSCRKIRHQVKRGVFTAKKAWFEVLLLLPTPAVFSRLSSLPFAIKVSLSYASPCRLFADSTSLPQLVSSDPSTTTRLPVDSVSVFLLQRVYVTAQGHCASFLLFARRPTDPYSSKAARHDTIVAKGVVEAEGPSEGTPLMGDASGPDGPPVWGKRLKGSIPLVCLQPPSSHGFLLISARRPTPSDPASALPTSASTSSSLYTSRTQLSARAPEPELIVRNQRPWREQRRRARYPSRDRLLDAVVPPQSTCECGRSPGVESRGAGTASFVFRRR